MPYADVSMEPPCAGLNARSGHEDLYKMGLVYSTGTGVPQSKIEAHKWFNLAVLKGSDDAKVLRQELADEMTEDELKQALKAAREWLRRAN